MFTTLDLFAGIGGFSLGLERTGKFRTVAFCEQDPKAQQVLKKHWPDVPIFDDVKTLSKDNLNEPIDLITGGFPCQDISLAGRGAGLDGERSGLWFEFQRLIAELRPQAALIENVSALRSRGLDQVLGGLTSLGYDAEWHCIPASAIGAPHRRDRIWIVAYPLRERMPPAGRERSHLPSEGSLRRNDAGGGQGDAQWQVAFRSSGQNPGDGVAHPHDAGLQGHSGDEFHRPEWSGPDGPSPAPRLLHRTNASRWWDTEPNVGRVAHGVPGRVDRLKQLGNAVVPQIPEMLGEAIAERLLKPSIQSRAA